MSRLSEIQFEIVLSAQKFIAKRIEITKDELLIYLGDSLKTELCWKYLTNHKSYPLVDKKLMEKKTFSLKIDHGVIALKEYLIKKHPGGANITTLVGAAIKGTYDPVISRKTMFRLSEQDNFNFIGDSLFYEKM